LPFPSIRWNRIEFYFFSFPFATKPGAPPTQKLWKLAG